MIFAIKPFEIHDGDGIRTTVFFKGCPLRCKWCHNPESLSFEKEILFDNELCTSCLSCIGICNANIAKDGKHIFIKENCTLCGKCEALCPNNAFDISGKEMSAEEIADAVLKDEIFMKGSGGGVTFSGGEPLMQVDLCIETARILKKHGINIAVDTSGFVKKETLDKIIPYTDTFLFDIKAIDDDVHIKCTGVSNNQILENIKYIDSLSIPMEIRYPYIPAMNEGEAEKIAEFVKNLKSVKVMRILPYHNYAERKYNTLGLNYPLPHIVPPTKEEISGVIEKIKHSGVKNAIPY
ncbi:MAG: glycyl-radical enzyme activating protein [Clostridia bacterium]|nr:glycyl-radical enzyme activating protein [Clostridia bacterium]